MRPRSPHTPELGDIAAERARRQHDAAITELQKRPAYGLHVLPAIQLADGIATPVAHKLGRAPAFVQTSCPRGPSSSGRIEEVRSTVYDRSKVVVLKATGWGATITVDVMVA